MNLSDVKDRVDEIVDKAIRQRDEVLKRIELVKVDPPAWSLKHLLFLVIAVFAIGYGIHWLSYNSGWSARGADFEKQRQQMTEKVEADNEQLVRELKAEIDELKRQISGDIAKAANLSGEKLQRIAEYQAKATSCGWVPETIKELNH